MAAAMLGGAAPALPRRRRTAPAKRQRENEDIIVTAQRRDESLSRTPVAVDVVGMQELAEQNVRSEADLPFAAPGLSVRAGATSNESISRFAGQSSRPVHRPRPGVLPYFNEVQILATAGAAAARPPSTTCNRSRCSRDRRGPCSGATRRAAPCVYLGQADQRIRGLSQRALRQYGTVQLEGALNLPIVDDRLLARVAGFYSDQTGFSIISTTGRGPARSSAMACAAA